MAPEARKETVLRPIAGLPEMALSPLAPRLRDLSDKVIYVIKAWRHGSELDPVVDRIAGVLGERFPSARVNVIHKTSPQMTDDPGLWDEVIARADAFVLGASQSCSTTTWTLTWAAALERRRRPGVVLLFDSLAQNAETTCQRLGMALRWVSVPYPPVKVTGACLSALSDQVSEALTRPLAPQEKKAGRIRPGETRDATFTGTFTEIQDFFCENGWSDGLPLVPPTGERVEHMLKGTSHGPQEVVTSSMWPERLRVTVEKVAVNGVMAGCRPEYMPVLLATVDAFSRQDYGSTTRSTNSFSFMQVVNGPIIREIAMNPGLNALGPGNRANASIGRALRLFIVNLGGGRPGVNIMGTQGNVSSYTFCFPENERQSPWEPFSVSRGYAPKESTVTTFSGGWSHVGNYCHVHDNRESLKALARSMATFEWPNGIVLLLSPLRARALAEEGFTRDNVAGFIHEHAAAPARRFRSDHFYRKFIVPIMEGKAMYGETDLWPASYRDLPEDALIPVYPRDHIYAVVVGGETNRAMQGWKMAYPSTASVDRWR